MWDEEEYVKRDPRLPSTNINEDGNEIEPLGYSLMPYSFFVIARIVLGIAIVIAIPFVLFDFSNSIVGFLKIIALYAVVTFISKVFGFTYFD